jgi:hypothetical protein
MNTIASVEELLLSKRDGSTKDAQIGDSTKAAEVAQAEASLAKGMLGESSNTSLPGLMASVTNIANKMYRLVKLKRSEWQNSVPVRDLKEVYEKVNEYNSKINEINIDDNVMSAHKDMFKLTISRLRQLNDEFTTLVKTSALNFNVNPVTVTGGNLKKKEMFIGENYHADIMSFFRK